MRFALIEHYFPSVSLDGMSASEFANYSSKAQWLNEQQLEAMTGMQLIKEARKNVN